MLKVSLPQAREIIFKDLVGSMPLFYYFFVILIRIKIQKNDIRQEAETWTQGLPYKWSALPVLYCMPHSIWEKKPCLWTFATFKIPILNDLD